MMKPSILRSAIAVLATVVLCAACAAQRPADGPGMTVTFSSAIKGKSIDLLSAISSSKQPFPNPGEFGPNANPITGGKTMGAAPDGRELPEWVAFTWKEWPYPYPKAPSDPVALQTWRDEVRTMSRSLPVETASVPVRARVPQDVVDEVLASNRRRAPRALPDEMLWVYFIWYDSGVKFRWSLERGCCTVLRQGGDDLEK